MLAQIFQDLRLLEVASRAGLGAATRREWEIRALLNRIPNESVGGLNSQLRFIGLVGSGIAPFLDILASHFEFAIALENQVEKAKTSAQLTGLLLRWLPWLALAATQVLGLSALSFLVFHPAGWSLIAVAAALSVAARFSSNRLIARVRQMPPDPGLWLSLVAGALRQGIGVNRCIASLRTCTGARLLEVEREIVASMERGGPMAEHLENVAATLRTKARQSKEIQVEQTPIRLLLPLGGFLVPQFMLLLVMPMVLSAFALA